MASSVNFNLKKEQITTQEMELQTAPLRPATEEDFVKSILEIVREGTSGSVRMDEQIAKVMGSVQFPSVDNIRLLIAQVKEAAPMRDLPNTYRHLIRGLNLNPEDYSLLISFSAEDNQAFRLACALMEVEKNHTMCALTIKRYGITDQAGRIQIAKAIAARSGYAISATIHLFEITDKQELVNIALLAGAQNWQYVTTNLGRYNFETEDLVALLKNVAIQDVEKLYEILGEFRLSDQNALFEIAKTAAIINPVLFAQNIEKFGQFDQDKLIALARLATTASKGTLSEWIPLLRYKILKRAERLLSYQLV